VVRFQKMTEWTWSSSIIKLIQQASRCSCLVAYEPSCLRTGSINGDARVASKEQFAILDRDNTRNTMQESLQLTRNNDSWQHQGSQTSEAKYPDQTRMKRRKETKWTTTNELVNREESTKQVIWSITLSQVPTYLIFWLPKRNLQWTIRINPDTK